MSRFLLLKISFALLCGSYLYCEHTSWAEKTLSEMTLFEKIAQLFMIPVYSAGPYCNVEETLESLESFPVGGILFMQGTIKGQQDAALKLQSKNKYPLICAQDCEWGLEMRLKETMRFPRNLTLGALRNDQLIYDLGAEIANQCRTVGVHVNFGPVIDINDNPSNPVINDRSFGENPSRVAQKSSFWVRGLQDGRVIACAKHFPGHGSTLVDSHTALPTLHRSIDSLEDLEWIPFKKVIDCGVQSIMIGHLSLPQVSSLPASLCPTIVTTLLKRRLKFDGLVFTDAMNMRALKNFEEKGQSEILALRAGNDMIVFPKNYQQCINKIYQAASLGEISEGLIDKHVLKVLQMKEKLNLHENRFFEKKDLFTKEAQKLKECLYKEAITAVKLTPESLPLKLSPSCAFIQIGQDVSTKDALEMFDSPVCEAQSESPALYAHLNEKQPLDFFYLPRLCSSEKLAELKSKLSSYENLVIGVYEMNKHNHKDYGISKSTLQLLQSLRAKSIYLCLFGSPYSLKFFEDQNVILMAYENEREAQIGCAEILLGIKKSMGKLPVSASEKYPEGWGL